MRAAAGAQTADTAESLRESIFARNAMHKTGAESHSENHYTPELRALVAQAYAQDYELIEAIGAHPEAMPTSGAAWLTSGRQKLLCEMEPQSFGTYCSGHGAATPKPHRQTRSPADPQTKRQAR